MAPESTSASTVSNQTIQIAKPAAGETLNITSVPGGNLAFSFDPAAATITRTGNDLMVEVDGGGTVRLSDFFVVGDQPLPSLTMPDGVSVASADFLSNFNIELETAAGPGAGAGAAGSGAGEYADDAGSLVDGIDRLGSLGTDYWGYESDVTEQFENLALDDGGVTVALPGGTTPGETPEIPVPAGPALVAQPNANTVDVEVHRGKDEVIEPTFTGKMGNVISGGDITGQVNGHSGQLKVVGEGDEQGISMFATGGFEKAYGWDGAFIQGIIDDAVAEANGDAVTFRNANGDAAVLKVGGLSVAEGGSISFDYTFAPDYASVTEPDVAFYMVYDLQGNLVASGLISQIAAGERMGEKGYNGESGTCTIAGLPEGDYTLYICSADVGDDGGKKALLTVSGLGTVVPGEIIPGEMDYEMSINGNVITYNLLNGLEKDGTEDYRTDGKDLNDPKILEFSVQGKDYSFDPEGPDAVAGNIKTDANGRYIEHEVEGGGVFTMYENGYYSYHNEGTGLSSDPDPKVPALDVQYTVKDADIDEAASSTLYLRGGDDQIIIGTDGNDILKGGSGDDVIFGGGGDDIMYGGLGADTFVWTADHMSGKDTIMDFELNIDKLSFEDYFGTGGATLDNILAKLGAPEGERLELLTADELSMSLKVGDLTVDLHFEGAGLTEAQVTTLTSGTADEQAALLLTLFNS